MKELTVEDMNMQVQKDYLFFLDTCCLMHPRSKANGHDLYRCFKQCLKMSNVLQTYVGEHEFEAMLEYSGLIRSEDSGSTIWEGIDLHDHWIRATYNYFEFPQIYLEKVTRNPETFE